MGQANTSADDVKAFGKVPVFYNGRVTTHEQVAQSLLFRITAEENLEIKVSGEDKPLSASLWLLDVLANHKRFRTYRIFDVSNELKMLMGTENQQGRVNFDQLSKVRKVIGEAFNKQQDTNSAELIVNGIKLDRGSLAQTLQSLEWIEEINFFHQTELDPQRMADVAISSMRYPIPLYAPPPGDGFEWETAVFADVFDQVKKSKRREIALFKDILRSHREDQAEDFSKAVQAYSEIIKKADFPTPLSFSVPKGWKEVNNPRGMNLEYFNDFNGFGMPIASFHCGPEFKCMGDWHVWSMPLDPWFAPSITNVSLPGCCLCRKTSFCRNSKTWKSPATKALYLFTKTILHKLPVTCLFRLVSKSAN